MGSEKQPGRELVQVFGVNYDIGTMGEALDFIAESIANGGETPVLCNFVNAHCLNLAYKDQEYKDILNTSSRVWADGIGAALGAKRFGKKVKDNVNGTDMLPLLCQAGHKLYLLGGKPGVAQEAMNKLNAKYGAHCVVGCWDGYFGSDSAKPLADIESKQPDILLVGMGVPKQEFWLAQHQKLLKCKVAMGVGGLLDFASERIPRAPMWMRKMKLEWIFRLMQEPRRLFKRYVLGNPLFIFRLICH